MWQVQPVYLKYVLLLYMSRPANEKDYVDILKSLNKMLWRHYMTALFSPFLILYINFLNMGNVGVYRQLSLMISRCMIMVIVKEKGIGTPSSNSKRESLRFISRNCSWERHESMSSTPKLWLNSKEVWAL